MEMLTQGSVYKDVRDVLHIKVKQCRALVAIRRARMLRNTVPPLKEGAGMLRGMGQWIGVTA